MRVVTLDIPKRNPQSRSTSMRYSPRHVLPHSTPRAEPRRLLRPAITLRALVLLLIILLLIFVGLMHVTGGYDVGGPVLGSILLIGLGATHYAR
jgi:hypothetical protein